MVTGNRVDKIMSLTTLCYKFDIPVPGGLMGVPIHYVHATLN